MKLKKVSLLSAVLGIAVVGAFGAGYLLVSAYSGQAPKYLVEGDLNVTEVAPVEQSLGAFPGDEIYNPIRLAGGLQGRTLVTSSISTSGDQTLLESDLQNYDIFDFTSLMDYTVAWTFPATSTLSSILQNVGDSRRWIFVNHVTSTSATVLTLTAGAGWDLMGVDANVDTLAADSVGVLDCWKQSASSTFAGMGTDERAGNIYCNIQESINVD